MIIALGSDHAGFELKDTIKRKLETGPHRVIDVGTQASEPPVATAAIARLVAQKVLRGEAERGVLICGTGGGISVAANRYPGIRALLCFNRFTAEMARKHNDANVLALGSRTTEVEVACELVDIFLNTPFGGGKYLPRIKLLEEIEREVYDLLKEKYGCRE
ncbi:MAG TPA: ribose 5-phosphate isomerase B [Atribacteraceae bacterium]|nr:ribose 5-phosphate isomerase B [Atribacteraceae bacterium]